MARNQTDMAPVRSFSSLSMRSIEETLVGCCIRDEFALAIVLDGLPPRPFRSEVSEDLHRILYILVGWHERGAYDIETNEDRLAHGLAVLDKQAGSLDDISLIEAEWAGYLDLIWSPCARIPDLIAELCAALKTSYAMEDAVENALHDYLQNAPINLGEGFSQAVYLGLIDASVSRGKPSQPGGKRSTSKPSSRPSYDVFQAR